MELTEWFETRPGEALRKSESELLEEAVARLHGEVFVWATLVPGESPSWSSVHAGLCVTQVLDAVAPFRSKGPGIRARLSALPYASGSIDAFILQHGLEVEPDLPGCVREIARVLRDGGRSLVVSLDPRGSLGVRALLGRLPQTPLLEPFALHCSKLTHAHSLRRCCVREGLFCERQTRILRNSGSAILTEVCKRRSGVHLLDQVVPQQVGEGMGLLGATSRAATRSQV